MGLTRANFPWLILGEHKSVRTYLEKGILPCPLALAEGKIASGKFTKMVPYTRFNLNNS